MTEPRNTFLDSETEICVSCRKDTGIPKNCHVDDPKRKGNYVEGAGQLCEECADTIYPKR